MKSYKYNMFVVFLFACFIFPRHVYSEENIIYEKKVILSGPLELKESKLGTYLNSIFDEAFHRLGMSFEFESYPAIRSGLMSETGYTDGEISRNYNYSKSHPDMIRVDVPLYFESINAYAYNKNIYLDGWRSLENKGYVANYRLGVEFIKKNLSIYMDEKNIEAVVDLKLGMKKLLKGRADLVIALETSADEILDTDEFYKSGIYVAGVLDKGLPAYAYLNKKNKPLVILLEKTLIDMRNEGIIKDSYKGINFNIINNKNL